MVVAMEEGNISSQVLLVTSVGEKGHINKYCRSKVAGSSGNPTKKFANELPKGDTNKPVLSDTRYLATSTITCNKKK